MIKNLMMMKSMIKTMMMRRYKFHLIKTDLKLIVIVAALTSVAVGTSLVNSFPARSATSAERVSDALEAGDTAFVDAQYQVALNNYQAAADILRKSGTKYELIGCLTKIAGTALKLNDHSKAKVALIEAVGICNSVKDFTMTENTSAPPINMLLKEYDRDKNFDAIQNLCEDVNAAAFVRYGGANLDASDKWLEDVYRERKMSTQLEKHYLKEIARLQAMNNRYLFYFAGLYDGLGRIYLESNKLPQAKDAFTKAIRIDQSGFNWSMSKQLTSSYEGLARCAELMHDTAQVKRIQSVLAKITTPDRRSSFPLQKFYDLTNAAQKLPASEAGEAIAKLEEARAILRQFYIFDVVLDAELDVKEAKLYSVQGKDKESKLAFEHSMAVLDGLEKAGLDKDNFVRLRLVRDYINALNEQGKQNIATQYADLLANLKADTERYTASHRPAVTEVTGPVSAVLSPGNATVFHGDKVKFRIDAKNVSNPKLHWSVRNSKGLIDAKEDRTFGMFLLGYQCQPGRGGSSSSGECSRNECIFEAEFAESGTCELIVDVLPENGTTPLATATAKITVPEPQISITPNTVMMAPGQRQDFTVVAKQVGADCNLKFDMPRNSGFTGGIDSGDPQASPGQITLTGTYIAPVAPHGPVEVKALLCSKGYSQTVLKKVQAKVDLPQARIQLQ